PDIRRRLTIETLLKAVALATEEVESWRHGEFSNSSQDGSTGELRSLLPAPSSDLPHLDVHIRLKSPSLVDSAEEIRQSEADVAASQQHDESQPQVAASQETDEPPADGAASQENHEPLPQAVDAREMSASEIALTKWQDLQARWGAIVGVEAGIETMR